MHESSIHTINVSIVLPIDRDEGQNEQRYKIKRTNLLPRLERITPAISRRSVAYPLSCATVLLHGYFFLFDMG